MNSKKNCKSLVSTENKNKIFSKNKKNVEEDEKEYTNEKKIVKKTGFNLIEVIIIMIITSMFGLLVGSFITYVKYDDGRSVGCSGVRKDTEEFSKVYDSLLNESYEEIDRKALLKSSIVGMIDYLEDPYAEYIESNDAIELNEKLAGEFVGLGIEITMEDGGKTTVVGVHKDSPASVAGILPGDIIVKFGDASLDGLSSKELSELIITDKMGAEFNLTVRRKDEELVFNVTSNLIAFTSVNSFVKEVESKKIGYISITNFAENTFEQFKSHYEDLVNENISGLIIDVRGNFGGDLTSAKNIAELFLDKDVTIFQKESAGKIEYVLSKTKKQIDVKVVFITDNCTASASEILVSALKENLLCDVVGMETYGKGTLQKMHELSDGSYIKYTTQKWLTSKGVDINNVGISPTHYVVLDEEYSKNPSIDNDNQLQYAFELFK